MARWSLVASVAVGLVVVLPACGGGGAPVLAGTPKVETAEPGQATCQVAKDPLNPLIVEWPGTSKVSLDSASQHGVVVVSYVGCVLKVLASCQAGGAYEMKPVTPVRDKVSIENETDLYARLPLGVASLKGELKTAQRLELEYVAVGQREVSKPPASLSGDCAGATHYVRSIVVGAYGLDAIGRALASASAEAGDIAGGGKRKEAIQHLRGSGDVAKCAARDKTTDCAAVLQLGLAPLSVSDGSVTSGGFGAGLGALTVVPTVREVTTLDSGATSLAKVDVALLRLLQDAKRADKSEVPMDQKAAAWAKLLGYSGDNPYKELAEKRRDDWTRAAEAEVRRREQVAKVCKQHETDSAKLAELLRLDDDVISQKQKAAYRAELAQVYAPYATALDECTGNTGRMVRIPAGDFMMGSNDSDADAMPHEKPAHRVHVNAFDMDVTEVTVAMYRGCVSTGSCPSPSALDNDLGLEPENRFCNWGKDDRTHHPLNCVSWVEATAYCQWAKKRLPSEEEWEYAARGSDGRKYPWGSEAPDGQLCWRRFHENKLGTCAAGTLPSGRSPFGLFDLAGNVSEWTSSPDSLDNTSARIESPRRVRGGSWLAETRLSVRSASRDSVSPTARTSYIGFRCAR